MRFVLKVVLISVALFWVTPSWPASPPSAPSSEEIRQSLDEVTKSLDVQRQLPNEKEIHERESQYERRRDQWSSGDDSSYSITIPAPAAIWGLLQWVLIGLVVIALVGIIAESVAQEWHERRSNSVRAPGVAAGESSPVAGSAEMALAKAEALAAAQQYGEAMHYVLSAALILLARDMGEEAPDSFTSRELLNVGKITPAARQPLRSLVVSVERAWFGKNPANPEDYQNARASFRAFASAWVPERP